MLNASCLVQFFPYKEIGSGAIVIKIVRLVFLLFFANLDLLHPNVQSLFLFFFVLSINLDYVDKIFCLFDWNEPSINSIQSRQM